MISIESTVEVQHKVGKPWTHGTTVGKGDHNHNNRSYTMCVTKRGQLITRNSKHVKPTWITAEQYHWDQLDKHIVTDPLDDLLKQIENQTQIKQTCTNNDQFNNIHTGNSICNTQQESTSNNNRNNVNEINRRMNNEQEDSVNNI